MDTYPETIVRRDMRISLDVPIEMDDGVTLRCDVYRPVEDGSFPVIMNHGPYGKWLHFEDHHPDKWDRMVEEYPETVTGTSNDYQVWETVDPEKWVPDGYAVVRVDSRGAARSPGYLDLWSARETRDFAECIEWAGAQPWSNGKVGLNAISYYAMNQWQVATHRPDHLTAMCVWEGASDFYRELAYHGGIYCTFAGNWFDNSVKTRQHGVGENSYRSRITGDWVAGPETLAAEELGANRADLEADLLANGLADAEYWEPRTPDLSEVDVPVLSAGNWGGHGLHLRGNVEGYLRAGSDQKWLEIHGGTHWIDFYTEYGLDLQKRFFGHFLKGEDTGWDEQPPVQLQIRHPGEEFTERHERAWPIPRTEWTRYYVHPGDRTLSTRRHEQADSITYRPLSDGVTFLSAPLGETTEITGPISATLFVSSETDDADLFLIVRVFEPDMQEVVFQGALDPNQPIALGWLRASHRKLDPERSAEWRPYHTHDEVQPLEPGEIYELDVEIWPTSIVAPAGCRLGLSVRGNDYRNPWNVEYDPESMEGERDFWGVGAFKHDDARDRPVERYAGDVTIHAGPDHPSHVLLPVVPEKEG